MRKLIYSLTVIATLVLVSACEDPIDVELAEGQTSLVVDAWLNNLNRDQVITLTSSQSYFDNALPNGVSSADVYLTKEDGSRIEFDYQDDGRYVYDASTTTIGDVGETLALTIDYDGTIYTSSSQINRVATIDSIGIEFRENEIFSDDGLYAQFFARDPVGRGDTYWIRTFVNGEYLSKTQELNIAFDAGFDNGSRVDGLIFIPPIRELTNRLDDDLLPIPYEVGDEVLVEIHSISNEAFRFLETARDQINNGDNGLFSLPQANTRTNIATSDNTSVLGFFNVAAVSELSRVIEM